MIWDDGILRGRRNRYLDIYCVDECCQCAVAFTVSLRPDAYHKAYNSSGRYSNEPCGYVKMSVLAVPRADVQLLVVLVAQLLSGTDDVLIIDFHIVSNFV